VIANFRNWLISNFRLQHEQAGHRPALVLSPKAYNEKVGLAILCPVTNQVKGYPFEVKIPDGLDVGGVVLSDQVKSLDWKARQARFRCKMPHAIYNEVVHKLNTLIRLQL